jgi:glycosyltransferase involved in cell wall biosynthesis
MKILAISPFLWTMGRGSGVPTLYRTLQEFGRHAEVHLLLPSHRAGRERDGDVEVRTFPLAGWRALGEFGPDRSIFSHPFPGGRLGRYLLDKILWLHFVVAASWHAWWWNRKLDADLFYGVTPYGAPVAFLLSRLARGRNATRLLGTFLAPLVERRGWRRLVWTLPHFTEVLAYRLPAAAVVVTDDGTRGAAVGQALGVRNVRCWRNGLDIPESSAQPGRQDLPVPALYVGQLVQWKRVDRLLEAVARARRALDGRLELTIVGDGPERLRLREICRREQIGRLVRFVGAASRERLSHYYLSAALFVCAHDLTCACNAAFEAMAAGLPVVATDVGDTARIVEHGREGLLVHPGRPEELARALELLAGDPVQREQMGRRARERVQREVGSWRERARLELECLC